MRQDLKKDLAYGFFFIFCLAGEKRDSPFFPKYYRVLEEEAGNIVEHAIILSDMMKEKLATRNIETFVEEPGASVQASMVEVASENKGGGGSRSLVSVGTIGLGLRQTVRIGDEARILVKPVVLCK